MRACSIACLGPVLDLPANALRLLAGALLALETQPLSLFAELLLGAHAGLLLGLAASLVGGHLDQLLGLLLGSLEATLRVAFQLLRPAQALLRVAVDPRLLLAEALLVLGGKLLDLRTRRGR